MLQTLKTISKQAHELKSCEEFSVLESFSADCNRILDLGVYVGVGGNPYIDCDRSASAVEMKEKVSLSLTNCIHKNGSIPSIKKHYSIKMVREDNFSIHSGET